MTKIVTAKVERTGHGQGVSGFQQVFLINFCYPIKVLTPIPKITFSQPNFALFRFKISYFSHNVTISKPTDSAKQVYNMKFTDYWKFIFLLVWISSTFIIAILIFTSGLLLHREELPYKSSCLKDTLNLISPLDIHEQQCSSSTLRVLLIIIDALRYDFIEPLDIPKNHELPYQNKLTTIHQILRSKPQHSKLFKFIADPPTATMQRIKALTTGSMSTFIDISSNFASSEIKEDNLIDILNQENRSAVFMGDNTWSKLYPNRFLRSYPFDSFNVWDLDTVDNGIKQNLFLELKNKDWNLLVAHFLGVDHCGHRYGTIHSEMTRKLSEMNDVLR